MFNKNWEFIYKKIAQDLNLEIDKDIFAADILNKLLDDKKLVSLKDIRSIIENKEVIVFGAGPSLENSIIKNKKVISNKIKIAADGATTALIKNNFQPDIIVTDLDGKIKDQIKSNLNGSIVVIHAHGDNIDKINQHLYSFKENIIGTTQINPQPFKNLHNFGGFTDGDRAIFFADFFNPKKIYLLGFDFNGEIGKYSFSDKKDKFLKLKKLKWCKYFINNLKKEKDIIQEL